LSFWETIQKPHTPLPGAKVIATVMMTAWVIFCVLKDLQGDIGFQVAAEELTTEVTSVFTRTMSPMDPSGLLQIHSVYECIGKRGTNGKKLEKNNFSAYNAYQVVVRATRLMWSAVTVAIHGMNS
jgi:hypothetical protein